MPRFLEERFALFRKTGSTAALGDVYDRVAPELLRVALHLAGDPVDAEDLLQETLIVAIEKRRQWDPARPLLPWMTGILTNEARALRRRRSIHHDPPGDRAPTPERGPVERAQADEVEEALTTALERVAVEWRPVLVLRLRHGLTATEIAAALERPPGTVRSQLARGLEVLRRVLPAGIAGALALELAPRARGLAAVREAVLAEAAALPIASTSLLPALAGLLAMKKTIAAAACVVALSLTWTFGPWNDDAPTPSSAERTPARPKVALHEIEPSADGTQLAEPAPEERARVASTLPEAEPPSTHGCLRVSLHWQGGEPVRGGVVRVRPTDGGWSDELVAHTNGEGWTRVAELLPKTWCVQTLRGGSELVVVVAGEEARVEMELEAGVTVLGRVVNGRDEPVAGAEIWVSEYPACNWAYPLTQSDREGRFRVEGVAGDHRLGARARGYAPSHQRGVRGAVGEEMELEIVLEQEGFP